MTVVVNLVFNDSITAKAFSTLFLRRKVNFSVAVLGNKLELIPKGYIANILDFVKWFNDFQCFSLFYGICAFWLDEITGLHLPCILRFCKFCEPSRL